MFILVSMMKPYFVVPPIWQHLTIPLVSCSFLLNHSWWIPSDERENEQLLPSLQVPIESKKHNVLPAFFIVLANTSCFISALPLWLTTGYVGPFSLSCVPLQLSTTAVYQYLNALHPFSVQNHSEYTEMMTMYSNFILSKQWGKSLIESLYPLLVSWKQWNYWLFVLHQSIFVPTKPMSRIILMMLSPLLMSKLSINSIKIIIKKQSFSPNFWFHMISTSKKYWTLTAGNFVCEGLLFS